MKTEREVMRFISEEIAKGEMTVVFKNRIARMLGCDEFHPGASDRSKGLTRIDMFFEASEGRIAEAYNRLTPGGKHGLGRAFKRMLDRIRYFYNGGYDKHETKEKEEVMVKEVVEVKAEEMKLIPLEDLKRVVDFMQLCDIEAINVMEILKFLDCVRARQKKPEKLADNPPIGLQA